MIARYSSKHQKNKLKEMQWEMKEEKEWEADAIHCRTIQFFMYTHNWQKLNCLLKLC